MSAPAAEVSRLEGSPSAAHAELAHGLLIRRTERVQEGSSATATITPQGGVLSIPGTGLIAWFPAGAVDHDIVVTASVIDSRRVAYDFQPHGTVFNAPIYIGQLLTGTELDAPRAEKRRPEVYGGYLANGSADVSNDGNARFAEVFQAAYFGTGRGALVVFQTTHFSGYAMASGRKAASELGLE